MGVDVESLVQQVELYSSEFLLLECGERVLVDRSGLRDYASRVLLGRTLFTLISPDQRDRCSTSALVFSPAQELAKYRDLQSLEIIRSSGMLDGIIASSIAEFRYIPDQDLWFVEAPLDFVFFDDVSQEEQYRGHSLRSLVQPEVGKKFSFWLPFSSASLLSKIGLLSDRTYLWRKTEVDPEFAKLLNIAMAAGVLHNTPIRQYNLVNKLSAKREVQSRGIRVPNAHPLREVHNFNLLELLEVSNDRSLYIKSAHSNNGVGIGKIERSENGWKVTIPRRDNSKELCTFYFLDTLTELDLENAYSELGYDIDSFAENYYLERGIKKLEVNGKQVEFRISIAGSGEGEYAYRMRILPESEGKKEYRCNIAIGGGNVEQGDIPTFLEANLGDEWRSYFDRIENAISTFVNDFNSKCSDLLGTYGLSLDVILTEQDGNDELLSFFLETQGMEPYPRLLDIVNKRLIAQKRQLLESIS